MKDLAVFIIDIDGQTIRVKGAEFLIIICAAVSKTSFIAKSHIFFELIVRNISGVHAEGVFNIVFNFSF